MSKLTVTPNALWRIHLRPATSGAETANEFCFKEKIVGFGWPIKSQPGVPFTSVSNYLAAAEDHYVANWSLHGEPRKNKGFRKAMSALTGKGKMRINDLVWTRTRAGIYYLGRITGNRNYLFAGSNKAAQRIAMMYSFFSSYREHDVNPRHWLTDVLLRIQDTRPSRMTELLPGKWKPAKGVSDQKE